MKIGVVAHRLATAAPSGVDRYLRQLVIALAERSDVTCSLATTAETEEPTWVPEGIPIGRVPGPRKAVNLAWSIAHRPAIDRFLETPDLVHITVPTFPVPCRAPVIYTIHDLMPCLHPEWFGRIHRWGYDRCMRDATSRAAAIVTGSQSTADTLTNVLGIEPTRIAVVPYGISKEYLGGSSPTQQDEAAAYFGLRQGRFALYVGQVTDRKNVNVLIHALARVDDSISLAIAGSEGQGAETVHEAVRRTRVGDRVRFLGYVPEALLPGLMAAARVLVHPSRFEGFGFTPLEAMAVGTPAVVAEATSLPGVVGDAALLADPDDADEWAHAIDVTRDDDARDALAERGRERAQQFSWANTAAATSAVYGAVLEGRPIGAPA